MKEFWGLPLAAQRRHAGAAAGDRDRGRGRARCARSAQRARARCASPISAPARARSCSRSSSELPDAGGVGTDISLAALACARANAVALGLARRASFVACDYGAALGRRSISSCPIRPMCARGEIAALAPEVRLFDPPRALDGGADGLDGYRAIAARRAAAACAARDLVVELGTGQLDAVAALFTTAGLAPRAPRHDLSGVARALVVKPLP